MMEFDDRIPSGSRQMETLMRIIDQSAEGRYDPDVEYMVGILSGYPECCVLFFVNVWRPALLSGNVAGAHRQFPHVHRASRVARRGYVRCPDCAARLR